MRHRPGGRVCRGGVARRKMASGGLPRNVPLLSAMSSLFLRFFQPFFFAFPGPSSWIGGCQCLTPDSTLPIQTPAPPVNFECGSVHDVHAKRCGGVAAPHSGGLQVVARRTAAVSGGPVCRVDLVAVFFFSLGPRLGGGAGRAPRAVRIRPTQQGFF